MAVSESRAEALLSTGLALAAELSLPVLLQRLIELAVELTEARYGALGVLSADGTHLVDFVTTGITDAERAAIGDLPHGRGILGVLIDEAHPLRLDDIAADARSVGFPPNHPHMRSFLGAPVRAHGRVFGNIYLTDKRTAPAFTAEDEAALVVLATQAGVAVANARLYDEVQRAQAEVARLKVLEDRERIARDLHDGIIQSLFAVGLGLQGTSAVIGDARLADRIQQAVAEIDRVIGDLRSYIFGLRPSVLAAGDLTNALEQLAH
ncbi:MAG: GAF domain-containing protein, partial [Chloroflexi bacterium]